MSLAWAGRCSSLLKRAECAGFSLFKRSIYCANDSILHRASARSCVCTLRIASTLSMPPKRKTAKAKAEGETEAKQTRTSPRKAKAKAAVEKETKKTKEENEDPPAAEKAEEAPAAAEEKAKKPKPKKAGSVREAIPDVNKLDFTSDAKTPDGKKWNMKFSSWNVNGIRAWVEKNGHSYIKKEDPDIFCVQETKCNKDQIPESVEVDGYHVYWLSGDKEGYSGTGLYSKKKPIEVKYGLGIDEHDKEGRVITAEYDNFFFVTAYVPNSGRGLPRLPYREKKWDPDFREYLKTLDKKKPVILCGDLNVAHEEIDLANPKGNKKGPGFTQQERDGFTALLEEGFIDSFRHLYPEETGAYSYWTYMGNARSKNVGWRLDYFVISEKLKPSLCDNVIRTGVMGSDHCPITLLMHME